MNTSVKRTTTHQPNYEKEIAQEIKENRKQNAQERRERTNVRALNKAVKKLQVSNAEQAKKKSDALNLLRKVLPMPNPIKRVIKRGATDGATEFIHEFELEDGMNIQIGTTSRLLKSPEPLRVAFADRLGVVLSKKFYRETRDEDGQTYNKAVMWDEVFQAILDASEIIETSSEADETLSWLSVFAGSSSLHGSDQEHMTEPMPFIDYNDKQELFDTLQVIKASSRKHVDSKYSKKGFLTIGDERCYLHIETFARFVNFHSLSAERMTIQKLSVRLTRLGFYRQEVGARQGLSTVKLRMYVSQSKFFESVR